MKINYIVSKTIECLDGDFVLLCLVGAVSAPFGPILTWYNLFLVVPLFKSDNFTECFDFQIYYNFLLFILIHMTFSLKKERRNSEIAKLMNSKSTSWNLIENNFWSCVMYVRNVRALCACLMNVRNVRAKCTCVMI